MATEIAPGDRAVDFEFSNSIRGESAPCTLLTPTLSKGCQRVAPGPHDSDRTCRNSSSNLGSQALRNRLPDSRLAVESAAPTLPEGWFTLADATRIVLKPSEKAGEADGDLYAAHTGEPGLSAGKLPRS